MAEEHSGDHTLANTCRLTKTQLCIQLLFCFPLMPLFGLFVIGKVFINMTNGPREGEVYLAFMNGIVDVNYAFPPSCH